MKKQLEFLWDDFKYICSEIIDAVKEMPEFLEDNPTWRPPFYLSAVLILVSIMQICTRQ